jgi:hypothetical protein
VAIAKVFVDRRNLAASLKDARSIVGKLESVIGIMLHIIMGGWLGGWLAGWVGICRWCHEVGGAGQCIGGKTGNACTYELKRSLCLSWAIGMIIKRLDDTR